jgi:2-succinyl-6-hydroxy-2,4-cyclohexadiene-1-carboxylate synthase
MGGRVALQLAAAAPGRVSSLILESASPGIADPAERAARVAGDAALAAQIEAGGLAWFADHWAGIPLFASQASLPAEARAALRERRMRGSARGLAGSLRGMGAGSQPSLWEALPGLTMPGLLISGALDAKYVAIGAQAARLMPNAAPVIIPDAGHTVHLERPEAFEKVVVGFLEQLTQK